VGEGEWGGYMLLMGGYVRPFLEEKLEIMVLQSGLLRQSMK